MPTVAEAAQAVDPELKVFTEPVLTAIHTAIEARYGTAIDLDFLSELHTNDIQEMLPVGPVSAEGPTDEEKARNQIVHRARAGLARLLRWVTAPPAPTFASGPGAPAQSAHKETDAAAISALCQELRKNKDESGPKEGPVPPLPQALRGLGTERQAPGDLLAGLQHKVNQGLGARKVPFLPIALACWGPHWAKCSQEGDEEVFGGSFPAFLHCLVSWCIMVSCLLSQGSDSFDPALHTDSEPPPILPVA